jgi:hypothetical protein
VAIWAEIKKAINDDFSKPLNKLITELINQSVLPAVVDSGKFVTPYNTTYTQSTVNTSTSTTVSAIKCTGKGKIYFVLGCTSYFKLTIKIDGVTVVNDKSTADVFHYFNTNGASVRDAIRFKESFEVIFSKSTSALNVSIAQWVEYYE